MSDRDCAICIVTAIRSLPADVLAKLLSASAVGLAKQSPEPEPPDDSEGNGLRLAVEQYLAEIDGKN